MTHIKRLYPKRILLGVGFSLGAGLLLKYLAEEGSEGCPLHAAVAISPAYDFHELTPRFNFWSSTFLVKGLVRWTRRHESFLLANDGISLLDYEGMSRATSVREFDQAAIVGKASRSKNGEKEKEKEKDKDKDKDKDEDKDEDKDKEELKFLHYPTVDAYYTASSPIHYSHRIAVPCLSISAADDPICSIKGGGRP